MALNAELAAENAELAVLCRMLREDKDFRTAQLESQGHREERQGRGGRADLVAAAAASRGAAGERAGGVV